MKIAVTSQNYRTVTGHAGKTRRFLVYEATPGSTPVEIERLDLDKMMTMHEFRNNDGSHPLDEVDVLITGSAGAGFIQKMFTRGVGVVVTGEEDPMQAVKDLMENNIKPPAPDSCNHHHHGHE
jgi:predicted Fe-Mo cluster-binding NifX family protein